MKESGKMDDIILINKLIAGDQRAFESLVKRYKDFVFNLCYRFMGDYDEADECAQEVFIKVYNSISSFQGKAAFTTWLYRIAVNTCKNRIILIKRRRQRTITGNDHNDGKQNDIGDNSFDPYKLYEQKEKQIRIYRALQELPPEERILVVLKDMEGKTYEEIAEITGMREGTVKSTLSRCRKKMRNMLRDIFP